MTALPELREGEAPPAIAAIYEDIKRATGIPQVNLIFRHLATVPGMLARTWDILGPLYLSGRISDCAESLSQALPPPKAAGILAELDAADSDRVAEVLRFYNHANRHNLIALSALVRLGAEQHQRTDQSRTSIKPTVSTGPSGSHFDVPRLPKLAELPDEPRRLVSELASRHGASEIGAVPSMYLHLAIWPQAISLAHDRIIGLMKTGSLASDTASVIDSANSLAADIAVQLAPGVRPPDTEAQAAALTRVAVFVENTIPEMVVVGHTLAA